MRSQFPRGRASKYDMPQQEGKGGHPPKNKSRRWHRHGSVAASLLPLMIMVSKHTAMRALRMRRRLVLGLVFFPLAFMLGLISL